MDSLIQVIKLNTPKLEVHGNINPYKLLIATALNESKFGLIRRPRFERGYSPAGGHGSTYSRSPELQKNYAKWGAWAACSYGSFQIMYQTAWELGYQGSPSELWLPGDEEGILWAIKLFNNRILPKATTVEQIADAYNSGTFMDSIIPEDYIAEFKQNYEVNAEKYLG